ncbi:DUF551 domain-containing protein [Klebsiella pneumoniae]|nr:DUF551 domain-containing protein [Klebsiella pneumoniae]MDY1896258.1 DUF551 domain-containing protein [Klebsiella pneumoniae]
MSITRERLLEIIVTGPEASGAEQNELARMALAAMDSEPVAAVPEDVRQALSKMDDEIIAELDAEESASRAAMDSEPDRNPVLAYADSYRDMAKQGLESVPIWSVITDLERNIAPLYRHAQPAPVVQCPYPCGWDNLNKLAIQDAAFVAIALVEGEPAKESIRQAAITNNDRLLKVISACRAAMLAAAPQSPGSEPAAVPGKWIPVSERLPDEGDHVLVSDGVGMEVSWIRGREWKKLRHIYSEDVTHWMPLPAAPQEVK